MGPFYWGGNQPLPRQLVVTHPAGALFVYLPTSSLLMRPWIMQAYHANAFCHLGVARTLSTLEPLLLVDPHERDHTVVACPPDFASRSAWIILAPSRLRPKEHPTSLFSSTI